MEESYIKNNAINVMIEQLYFEVKAYTESEYNIESNLDGKKKESNKIIFKDRKKAITIISKLIEDFSAKYNVDKNFVKNYLLKLIEKDLNLENNFKEEYIEVKKIVCADEEER